MKWQTIEMLGYTYYSEKGYRIFTEIVGNADFDFIAYKDGNFVRVNVKKAQKRTDKKEQWKVTLSGGSKKTPNNVKGVVCDIYLVWVPEQERFIELDGDFFLNVKSKSKTIPIHKIRKI